MTSWVFLRGLMRERRHWGDFPTVFRRHVGSAQIILQDLPGNGSLHRSRSPLQVGEMLEMCRRALRDQGHCAPYRLLGLSMGGMVAAAWAHAYPEELRGCVLINSSLRPFSPFHHRLYWRSYASILRLGGQHIKGGDPALREHLIWKLTVNASSAMPASLLDAWVSYQRDHPVSSANALRQLLAASRFRIPAVPPPIPVLVIASAADRLVHPDCSVRLARAWRADLRIHPSAGHDLPLEDAPWVGRQVADWLACQGEHIGASPRIG